MLVLSTRLEDGIQIGPDITIKVLDVRMRNVRLGIQAPRSVPIQRDARPPQSFRRLAKPVRQRPTEVSLNGSVSALLISRDQLLLTDLRAAFDKVRADLSIVSSSITARQHLCVEELGEPVPDLIVIDLDLPGRSSIEFIRWIRGHAALVRLPLVAVGSADHMERGDMALEEGANLLLRKGEADLAESIKSAVQLWGRTRRARNIDPVLAPAVR